MSRILTALGKQGARVALLLVILGLSGVFLGLAAGYPVSRIQFEESDAVRVDQGRLAGQVDPAQAVVAQGDLPLGWDPGDPALGAFGLLGSQFCGEEVPLPTALSDTETAVFANPADDAFLISQAVRVDRWQSARDYVDDVGEAVGGCDRFFRTDLGGTRVRVDIEEGTGTSPITDHVSRSFVAEDGSSVQVWSMMAVGDVVVVLLHGGPARPREGLLSDLEDRILARVDPEDFAPGGVAPTTTSTTTTVVDPTATTVLEGGAADESATTTVPPSAPPTTVPTTGAPDGFQPTD
jgi:hypothetical protein